MNDVELERRVDDLLLQSPLTSVSVEEFWGAQFDRGLARVNFPVGEGGLDLQPARQELVDVRLEEAHIPSNLLRNFIGLGMAAPTLVAFGTPQQKQRFLRKIFTCEELWCQLFSEPNAGSDLASLSTSAVRDGETWRISGHKVWTTLAHVARWGVLLARTDPDVPKHAGLTYFICDMQAEGIEIRPLRQISGDAEFNEVIFHDVCLPDELRLGEAGKGWSVTLSTLNSERHHNGQLSRSARGGGVIGQAVDLWRQQRRDETEKHNRDELMKLWIEAEVIRLLALRAHEDFRRGESGAEGSLVKLAIGELAPRIYEYCLTLMGAHGLLIDSYEMRRPSSMGENTWGSSAGAAMAHAFLESRSHTIGGGTSEMQRNTIGERLLGLPKEPNTQHGVAWSELRLHS